MPEHTFFLGGVEPSIYVAHHAPQETACGVAVLLSPFAEEKKTAQRPLVEAARALAGVGWHALRFDFRGTGDSGGDFGDFDLEHWREDLGCVWAWAQRALGELPRGLLGVRLGATLALAEAARLGADWIALWEPVTDGGRYMRQNRQRRAIRRLLTDAGAGEPPAAPGPAAGGEQEGHPDRRPLHSGARFPAFDFDGFPVSARLHEQIAGLNHLEAPPTFAGRVWLAQIGAERGMRAELAGVGADLERGGARVSLAVYRLPPFWSRVDYVDTSAVREGLIEWLQQANSE